MDTPTDQSCQDEENLPGGKRGSLPPSASPGEKVQGDGHRETSSREELSEEELGKIVDYLVREMEKEEEKKRLDAYIAAHAEESREKFMQTLRASYEENAKEAQRMRDLHVPEASEQAGDENPSNAC